MNTLHDNRLPLDRLPLDTLIGLVDLTNEWHDSLTDRDLDTTEADDRIDSLYTEITRRVDQCADPQEAYPLAEALFNLIYGRDIPGLVPRAWKERHGALRLAITEAYHRHPMLTEGQYLLNRMRSLRHLSPAAVTDLNTEAAAIIARWESAPATPAQAIDRRPALAAAPLYLEI